MTPEQYIAKLDGIGWFAGRPNADAARAAVLKRAQRLADEGKDVTEAPVHVLLTADYENEGDYEHELLKMADDSHGLFRPMDILEIWGEEMRFRFVEGDNKYGVKRAEHEEFATELFPSIALNAGRHVSFEAKLHALPLDRDPYVAYVWATDEALAAAHRAELIPWDAGMEPILRDLLMAIAELPGMTDYAPEDGFALDELEDEELDLSEWELDGDEIEELDLSHDPDAIEEGDDEDLDADPEEDRYDPAEDDDLANDIDEAAVRAVFDDDADDGDDDSDDDEDDRD